MQNRAFLPTRLRNKEYCFYVGWGTLREKKMDFAFYTDAEKKLKELRSKEEKIEVKEGTKIIGSFAFRAPNAKEIALPDSVETIQMYAFGN